MLAVALVAAALAPAQAPGMGAGSPPAPKQVAVLDDLYSPSKVSVRRGGSVEWVWAYKNLHPHNVRLLHGPPGVRKKRYRSQTAVRMYDFERAFPKPGVYRFLCTLHPFSMRQAVVVRSVQPRSLPAPVARGGVRPVGWAPLSSAAAAARVKRNGREPRPENKRANHTVPGPRELRAWQRRSDMPYADQVDGAFRGTTDEIIRWAALKWGLPKNVLRAVAVVESWWRQSTVGDAGDSFGLFQVRRPYHCWGECRIARRSTAFNADYYGGIIRAYFDGKMGWLNSVEHGKRYRPGDLWGSVGAWFAGRWWTPPARSYVQEVQRRLRERTWTRSFFLAG